MLKFLPIGLLSTRGMDAVAAVDVGHYVIRLGQRSGGDPQFL